MSNDLAFIPHESETGPQRTFAGVYDHLHRLASRYLSGERRNHTLQPTALVHEAYVKMVGREASDWQSNAQLIAYAAQTMRHILVNHARAKRATKRGGDRQMDSLEETVSLFSSGALSLIDLDDELLALARFSRRLVQVVELRFFGGLAVREAAAVLGISESTVERDWSMARAWLHRRLEE